MTTRGPVHVYQPANYDAATAGTLVYVHGYYTDLDTAWRQHRLTAQFGDSNVNALFISPEAPQGNAEPVRWESLRELLDAVAASGVDVPRGAVVALAHSGGFRTVVPWLDSGLLHTVVLLDALYGNEDRFGAWAAKAGHSLVLVGAETTGRIERFVAGYEGAGQSVVPVGAVLGGQKRSHVLFLRSQVGHMELVTEGRSIPEVLRLTVLSERDRG
jgi:hypothetical protein